MLINIFRLTMVIRNVGTLIATVLNALSTTWKQMFVPLQIEDKFVYLHVFSSASS